MTAQPSLWDAPVAAAPSPPEPPPETARLRGRPPGSPLARRNAEMAARYRAGAGLDTLAVDYGLTIRVIRDILKGEGVALPDKRRSPAPQHNPQAERDGLIRQWRAEGKTLIVISDLLAEQGFGRVTRQRIAQICKKETPTRP